MMEEVKTEILSENLDKLSKELFEIRLSALKAGTNSSRGNNSGSGGQSNARMAVRNTGVSRSSAKKENGVAKSLEFSNSTPTTATTSLRSIPLAPSELQQKTQEPRQPFPLKTVVIGANLEIEDRDEIEGMNERAKEAKQIREDYLEKIKLREEEFAKKRPPNRSLQGGASSRQVALTPVGVRLTQR